VIVQPAALAPLPEVLAVADLGLLVVDSHSH